MVIRVLKYRGFPVRLSNGRSLGTHSGDRLEQIRHMNNPLLVKVSSGTAERTGGRTRTHTRRRAYIAFEAAAPPPTLQPVQFALGLRDIKQGEDGRVLDQSHVEQTYPTLDITPKSYASLVQRVHRNPL